MNQMNRSPSTNIEKAVKLKEALNDSQLYRIADALMRNYFGPVNTGDRQERAKIKELLELVVAACPNAKHYLDDINARQEHVEPVNRQR
jgi:hypothetical protein